MVIGHNKEGGEKEAPPALPRSLSRLSPAPARSAPLRSLGRRPNISDLATQRRRGGPVTLRSVHPLFVTKRTLAGGAAPPARRAAPKATRWRHRLSVAECLGRTRHLISASSSFHRPHPRSLARARSASLLLSTFQKILLTIFLLLVLSSPHLATPL